MAKEIQIGNKTIGERRPCFIIAEAGVNHDGDIEKAKLLIDIAKDTGVDVVKFQTWITEEIVTKDSKTCEYQKSNTGETSQFDMIKKLELGFEEFKELKKYADEKDIIFMSTPDDEKSVDFLFELGVPAFKIGSGELTNERMLVKIAKKKLPIILSTGMATLEEVEEAVKTITRAGNNQLILLHCTSNYPAKLETVNMNAMLTMKKKFGLITGYSDHTEGIAVPIVAALLGAEVIEKHYTYDKNAEGPDHKASLNPDELKKMVQEIRRVEKLDEEEKKKELKKIKNADVILGSFNKGPVESELEVMDVVRKSIVAYTDIRKGQIITKEVLSMKRPGTGLPSQDLPKVIGKKAKQDIAKDTLIKLEILE